MSWKTLSGRLLYRIGDVIISTSSENPSKIYGGTWSLLCPGRTLVCIDTSDGDFNSVKKVGGEKKHTLTLTEIPSHNHSGNVGSSGAHTHSLTGSAVSAGAHVHSIGVTRGYNWKNGGFNGTAYDKDAMESWSSAGCSSAGAHTHSVTGTAASAGSHEHSVSINNAGSGNSHNNLQPYMTVYMWVRIA